MFPSKKTVYFKRTLLISNFRYLFCKIALLGGSRKPITALGVSIALGAAAGLGEEMLFRGVLQSELGERFGDIAALTSSAVIFGKIILSSA